MRQKSQTRQTGAAKAIKDICRATRKQYSAEEKIRIVLDGLRGEETIAELCRCEGIAQKTDTPGGTGVIPRGMLRNILLLAAATDLTLAEAIAVATGNTARAHGLDEGFLKPGAPADLVIAGPVEGSAGTTLADAIAHGDLPGISFVFIDGEIVVNIRTPPPASVATFVMDNGGCPFCYAEFVDQPMKLVMRRAVSSGQSSSTKCPAPGML